MKPSPKLPPTLKPLLEGIDGWLSDEVACLLFETAKSLTGRGEIVEIGSWKGRSTICLAHGSSLGPKVLVHAIDPHTGSQEHRHLNPTETLDTFAEFKANIDRAKLSTLVKPLKTTSTKAAEKFDQPIELLWIDGSHDHKDVLSDFVNWFPKLVPGGWVLFHDSKWPGVRKVLWEQLYPLEKLSVIQQVEDTTFAQKLSSTDSDARTKNAEKLKQLQEAQDEKRRQRKLRKKT